MRYSQCRMEVCNKKFKEILSVERKNVTDVRKGASSDSMKQHDLTIFSNLFEMKQGDKEKKRKKVTHNAITVRGESTQLSPCP